MIANVLKRLRCPPPPPAAATCPPWEHIPSPAAPCPAPGVGPSCGAAASRRDGHLGQTELFIQFTSLKLHELRAAPRPHRSCPRGCSRGLRLGTLRTPRSPRAALCRGGRQHGTAVPVPGWGAGRFLGTRARSRAGGTHGHVPAEVRGQGPERVRGHGCAAGGRCARWHPALCRDACVSMHAHVCPCVSPMRVQPCLAPPAKDKLGAGGVRARGSCTANSTRLCVHSRGIAVSLPRHGGLHVPGVRGRGPPPAAMGGNPAWEAGCSSQ